MFNARSAFSYQPLGIALGFLSEFVFSAKGAAFIYSLGQRPGNMFTEMLLALKARFITTVWD
jgi:hypothetical protein